MRRPFSRERKLGPFLQLANPGTRNTYLVMYTVESDMVLDGSDITELEQSLKSEQVENGGDLFAIVEDVNIDTRAFSSLRAAGEERRFKVKTEITPDIQGTEDRFVLTKSMIDIIERKVKNKFGSDSIEGSWEIDVVE